MYPFLERYGVNKLNTSDMIIKLCNLENVSVSELARRIGQTPQNLGKKLKRDTLTLKELMQIADALDARYIQTFVTSNGTNISIDSTCKECTVSNHEK